MTLFRHVLIFYTVYSPFAYLTPILLAEHGLCATMMNMEFDPHTLHQIIQRIQQQMRCPQCGEKVPADFASVRLTGDDFVLMQLRCDGCDAYIVLHASLASLKAGKVKKEDKNTIMNASSTLCLKDSEIEVLRSALQKSGGSFGDLFVESKEDIA